MAAGDNVLKGVRQNFWYRLCEIDDRKHKSGCCYRGASYDAWPHICRLTALAFGQTHINRIRPEDEEAAIKFANNLCDLYLEQYSKSVAALNERLSKYLIVNR